MQLDIFGGKVLFVNWTSERLHVYILFKDAPVRVHLDKLYPSNLLGNFVFVKLHPDKVLGNSSFDKSQFDKLQLMNSFGNVLL